MSRIKLQTLLILVLATLLLPLGVTRCAGESSSAPYALFAAPLAQLPPLPTGGPRGAAAEHVTNWVGTDTFDRGGNCIEDGNDLHLEPNPGEYAWARYGLWADVWPITGITVTLEIETEGGSAFVALSDYDHECWVIHEFTESGTVDVPFTQAAKDPIGRAHLVVLAPDGVTLVVNQVSLTIDMKEWTMHTITDSVAVGFNIDMFVQNGQPMIAYGLNSLNGGVGFARASVPLPTDPGLWHVMSVDTGAAGEQLGYALVAASIGGKPAIAYFDGVNHRIRYARATTATPSSFEDWFIHRACSDTYTAQSQLGLVEYDGTPRLAYIMPLGRVGLAVSDTAEPVIGSWDYYPVTETDTHGAWPALTTINDRLVLFMNLDGVANIAYALNSAPTGPADWAITSVDHAFDTGTVSAIARQQIGADLRPVVTYVHGPSYGSMLIARPEITEPASYDDWIRIGLGGQHVTSADMVVADNLAYVIYFDQHDGSIYTRQSTVAEFESYDDFTLPISMEGSGISGAQVCAAVVGTTPVIAYYESTGGQLRFGFYSD